MQSKLLQIGRAYYRLTYADSQLTIPGVEALIYIGKDVLEVLEDEPNNAPYAFQDTISYSRFGAADKYVGEPLADEDIPCIYSMTEEDVLGLKDLPGAIVALQEAHSRGNSIQNQRGASDA